MAAPCPDELEVSIFSRGSGEAIAVHVGQGRWLLIDSLLSEARSPIALDYLSDIGVAYDCIESVLFTHWHDDHIAGAGYITERCVDADIAIPIALQNDEFIGLLNRVDSVGSGRFSSGVAEMQRVIAALDARGAHPRWCASNRLISGGPAASYNFEALSPSDADITNFLTSTRAWLETQATGGRLVAPNRNDASVASVVSAAGHFMLFGADLEIGRNGTGWGEVHRSAWRNRGKSNFVKIPHHGSKNAHFGPMWSDMAQANVYAALTPWNKNQGLPTTSDVDRILALTENAYAASRPLSRRSLKRMASVEGELRREGISITRSASDLGHLRFRLPPQQGAQWNVEVFGAGAAPLLALAA